MSTLQSLLLVLWSALTTYSLPQNSFSGQETQQEFDEETASFTKQGLCRAYLEDGQVSNSVSTCTPKCGGLVQQAVSSGNYGSVTCISGGVGLPTYTDPNGLQFNVGECKCNIPFLDKVVEDVVLSLPAIAEIGCEILFDALDKVIEVGSEAIPGIGEMDAGVAAALDAAKTIYNAGKDANDFLGWFQSPCGVSNYTQKVDQIFNTLTSDPVSGGISAVGGATSGGSGIMSTSQALSNSPTPSHSVSMSSPHIILPFPSFTTTPTTTANTNPITIVPVTQSSSASSVTSITPTSALSSNTPATATFYPVTTQIPSSSDTIECGSNINSTSSDVLKLLAVRGCNFNAALPDPPVNTADIPSSATCTDTHGEAAVFSSDAIIAAVQQGTRYFIGGQVAIKGGEYPHQFQNTPEVDHVTILSACADQTNIQEFPILRTGVLVDVGKNSRAVQAGPDRVLFVVDGSTVTYCGIMSHNTPVRVGNLLPFGDCVV